MDTGNGKGPARSLVAYSHTRRCSEGTPYPGRSNHLRHFLEEVPIPQPNAVALKGPSTPSRRERMKREEAVIDFRAINHLLSADTLK